MQKFEFYIHVIQNLMMTIRYMYMYIFTFVHFAEWEERTTIYIEYLENYTNT